MQFEFNNQLMPQNVLELDDIGTFGIEATTEDGFCYYLAVKTVLGLTFMITCGPFIPDLSELPTGFKVELNKLPYKEDKLIQQISYFLNGGRKGIVEAKKISFEEAIEGMPDIKSYVAIFDMEALQ